MTEEVNSIVRREILKLQLKTAKQIIVMLDLKETDFRMVGEFMLPSGIEDYLFGASNHFREQPNTYLDSVNNIYLEIRRSLAAKASGGQLTPRQILSAKKIIFQV